MKIDLNIIIFNGINIYGLLAIMLYFVIKLKLQILLSKNTNYLSTNKINVFFIIEFCFEYFYKTIHINFKFPHSKFGDSVSLGIFLKYMNIFLNDNFFFIN